MKHLGLTLIEVLLYIAIIGICLFSVVGFATNIGKINQRSTVQSEVQYALRFAESQIALKVRNAYSINWDNSVLNSDFGILKLNAPLNTISTVFLYNRADNRLLRQIVSGPTVYITPLDVHLDYFRISKLNDVTAVIDLSVSAGSPDLGPYRYYQSSSTLIVAVRRVCGSGYKGICP